MQGSFWNAVFTARDAAAMAAKYAWLRAAVLEAAGSAPTAALREAARRWPGSLRECQRVAPGRYRERERWAQDGAGAPDCAHAAWLARGHAAVVLWSELHRLVGDVLAWRAAVVGLAGRRPVGGDARDPASFLRDLTLRDPGRRAAWPEPAALPAAEGVGVGLAEACLAYRAGWDRASLRACLLDLASARSLPAWWQR
jgi:hypothetical protein